MHKKGFTLLEVLIAIVIGISGIFAVIAVFNTVSISSSDTENTAIALHLAEQALEELQNLDYETGIISSSRTPIDGSLGFEREITVTEPLTDLKQAVSTVYWQSKGMDASITLSTYISKN